MNARYQKLKVMPGTYIPDVGIQYPENDSFERLVQPVIDRHIDFDEYYPYLDDSWRFKLDNFFGYIFLYCIVFTLNTLRNGLRVEGRSHLKRYRYMLRNGAITVSNHVYRWDAPAILQAVHASRTVRIPMLRDNFCTKDFFYLRTVGGVPIPESMSALKAYNKAFDEFHRRGSWFHVFPEACRWDYYKPLRPFRKGAFTMAYKYAMPILPCVITFRPRKGIYRWFGNQSQPLMTVRIGTPIVPDQTKPRRAEVSRLLHDTREQMLSMAGILSNTWQDEG